jgi:hypothetical protein
MGRELSIMWGLESSFHQTGKQPLAGIASAGSRLAITCGPGLFSEIRLAGGEPAWIPEQ